MRGRVNVDHVVPNTAPTMGLGRCGAQRLEVKDMGAGVLSANFVFQNKFALPKGTNMVSVNC